MLLVEVVSKNLGCLVGVTRMKNKNFNCMVDPFLNVSVVVYVSLTTESKDYSISHEWLDDLITTISCSVVIMSSYFE